MSIRTRFVTAALVGLVAAALGLGLASPSSTSASATARAGAVARQFLQTINARRFARTCGLMSARFYRENHVPSKARCVLALRIGFTWAPSFRFKIVGVRVDGDRAVVSTLANGAPGQIVLVEETGLFRVLSVRGS